MVLTLKKKIPQLSLSKDELAARSTTLLPESVQTILKCISASPNISAELTQEIMQISVQARMMFEKQNMPVQGAQSSMPPAQTSAQQAGLKALVVNQGTNDMIQSMINMNLGQNFANSANKLLLSQLSSNVNPLTSIAS